MSMPPPPPPAPGDPPPQWQQAAQQQWAPQQQWQAAPPAVEKVGSPFTWVALVGALVCAVGSGMTWIDFPAGSGLEDITGFGTEGDAKDGTITIALAIIASILLILGGILKLRVLLIIAAPLMGLAALTGWVDFSDVNSGIAEALGASAGIGLWMVAIGATVATAAAIVAAVQTKKRPIATY